MFSSAKFAVLFTAVLSVAAMPPHMARSPLEHRELAARVAQPEPVTAVQIEARDMAVPVKRVTRRRRASSSRCKPENGSVVPSPSVKDDPKSSSEPAPSKTPEVKEVKASPTPKENPEPTSTTTKKPDPTPTPTPTPATPDTGSGGGQVYTGQGTFYATGLGACGITNNDGQDIAAVSHLFFDSFTGYNGANPNNNPMCGKTARVTYQGKTIDVQLVDRCEGCAYGDLDFSPHAFNQLASPSEGRISGISWYLVN